MACAEQTLSASCRSVPLPRSQAQRDFFGSHTYERTDKPAGQWYHTVWDTAFGSADSITTSGYNQ